MVLIPLAFLVRTPPGLAKVKAAASKASPSSDLEAYPVKIVPWLSIAAIFCCICMATLLIHVVALAQDVGIDSKSAASLLLLIYISSFVGRICYGKASDYIGGIRAYMLASASQTVMVFWFTQLNSPTSFYILATLFGLGYSGVMTCLIVCVREMTPVHRRGVSIAIVSLFAWLGMGLGGYQGGLFFDLTGDYTIAYAIAALAGVINLVILGSLRYHKTRKEASSAELKMA